MPRNKTSKKRSSKKNKTMKRKPSRSGLNKTEKKQTRAIAKKVALSTTEMKWCNPYSYDNYTNYDLPRQSAQLDYPWVIPGVSLTGQSACFWGLETGVTISTQGDQLNNATGVTPTGVTTFKAINQIGMYNFGTDVSGLDPGLLREGEYMYAHSQRVDIQVCMRKLYDASEIARQPQPTLFRVIVVKRRPRRVIATGAGPDFRTELFRNNANNTVGFLNDMSVKQLNDFKVNKEAFTVLHDFKFKLSNPIDPTARVSQPPNAVYTFPNTGNTWNSFPSTKELSMYLPKPKNKMKWNGESDSDPDDSFNFKVNIFVIASQIGSEDYQNQASKWVMRVQTESKFRDC